jgi:hypothetical protein
MDVFDAADFRGLLPKKLLRRIGIAILGFALLAPARFHDWYLEQAQQHAEHLTETFVDLIIPAGDDSPAPTDTPTGQNHKR